MTPENADTHERDIRDQFSRQAIGFAAAPELHADDIVALVVDAAKPQPEDKAIRSPSLRRLIKARRGLTERFDDKTADQAAPLCQATQAQAAPVLGS
jgi:hypothetical protein